MNHFFFEVRAREKLNELRSEGLVSQAFYRNKPERPNIFVGLWGGFSTILRFLIRIPQTEKRPWLSPGLKYKTLKKSWK